MGSPAHTTSETTSPPEPIGKRGPRSEVIPCVNPSTGESLGEVPIFSPQRIQAAVLDARTAFRSWRQLSFDERAEYLLRTRDLVLERQDEIIDALVDETGKVRTEALTEILTFCDTVGYYTKHGRRFLADEKVDLHLLKNKRVKSVFQPRGLVVNIAPWNYPLDLAFSETVPALLAGNAVIVKPSELTPLIALRMAEIFGAARLPKNVLQVVTGYGEAGAELCRHADFISFTGSVATGRKVAMTAAERLIPYTLELGGKDPLLVLEDANLERAARGAVWGAFTNSGQVCMSVERAYVVEAVYDQFVERVVELTRNLRQGIDTHCDQDVGSMIDPRQAEIVEAHVGDAVEKGARVLVGGKRNGSLPGTFYEPTVLVDVDESMDIMREETFGPVLPIRRVRDAEEALRLANDSRYGLNASIWSGDRKRADGLARDLESGAVCINDCLVSYVAVEAPFGGVKSSGVGRRRGPGGIRKYCHQKTVLEDILGLVREPVWYPYGPATLNGLKSLLRLLYQRGLGAKVKAVRQMLRW